MRIVDLGYVPFRWMRGFTQEEWHHEFELGIMQEAWRYFVLRMAKAVFPATTDFLFQREPNLRIHPPGGTAVPWHTDADFGHLPEEWNVWVPLTETTDDSQRLWVDWDGKCPGPIAVPLGSAFIFPGATMKHGNMVNDTDVTRMSFDFRLIEKRHYRDTGAKTVLYGVPLRVPKYWEEMT